MNDFSALVDMAIAINYNYRTKCAAHRHTLSPVVWAKEFCTIHIDIGRQVGKTTYIKKKSTTSDLIVLHNKRMLEFYCDLRGPTILVAPLFHGDELFLGSKGYDYIFVDEPSHIPPWSLDEIYDKVTRHNSVDSTFILLGK